MLGTIIGDIVGSRFGFNSYRSRYFDLFAAGCTITDDSITTLAVAKAILECNGKWKQLEKLTGKYLQTIGRQYPDCGFGRMFREWVLCDSPKPYKGFGDDAAVRVSPIGFIAQTEDEAKSLSNKVTRVTHDHPEGLKGAEAIAVAIFLARHGATKSEIKRRIEKEYYSLNVEANYEDRYIDAGYIPNKYQLDETCQKTVPLAIMAFINSVSFEDAIGNAVHIGGNSSTIAAIVGGLAEAYYGIPFEIKRKSIMYINNEMRCIYREWEKQFRKYSSHRKFSFLTKYIGKLDDSGVKDDFCDEFKWFVAANSEYELDKYTEILEKNNLKWETNSMQSADINSVDEQCILALIAATFRANDYSKGVFEEFAKGGYICNWLTRLKTIEDAIEPEEAATLLTEVKICIRPFQNGVPSELFISEKQMLITSGTMDGGNHRHQYEFGVLSEFGETCLNAMKACLESDGWLDDQSQPEVPYGAYLYELEAKYEDGKTVAHSGLFDRVHIPEMSFKKFIEVVQYAVSVIGFGAIINLDGFMNAIRHGEVKYCGVEFPSGGRLYHYRTNDLKIKVGDSVIVPVGANNSMQVVEVKTVEFYRWDNTPFPIEKTKEIEKIVEVKNNGIFLQQLQYKPQAPYLTGEIIDDDDDDVEFE